MASKTIFEHLRTLHIKSIDKSSDANTRFCAACLLNQVLSHLKAAAPSKEVSKARR